MNINDTILFAVVVSEVDLEQLKEVFPAAAVLTSTDGGNSDTDSATEDEDEAVGLPEPLAALYQPSSRNLPEDQLKNKCQTAENSLMVTMTYGEVPCLAHTPSWPHHCQHISQCYSPP